MRLKNKIVLVTGSTTGIGKAISLRCVAEGASVIIHGLERDLGEQVLAEIGSDKATLHIEDLSAEGSAQRLLDVAVRRFGRLDALVNNAAMVVSGNIHTCAGSKYPCTVHADQGGASAFAAVTRMRSKYWFR
jgi:NAD(P)-dependent dehydrogenase (short-subunit alcohol dehydrogenase family)